MTDQSIELIHTPNYQKIKQNFLNELTLASENKPSSISFITHHLSEKPLITKGIVQGIVIGGTNYILSTEEVFPTGERNILERKKGVLPTFGTKETFMKFLKENLNFAANAIGINFGFPLETITGSQGEIDGKLIKGTKEHMFQGLLHKPIGQLVKDIFHEQGSKEPLVSVANDTVCLTLSGNGTENGSLVAGTGFNACLVLHDNKTKILVNLESGNFNKFKPSQILQQIDKESEIPGSQLLEKTISGKYLARYFNEKIKELTLPISPITTSQELSELSHANHTDVAGDLARAIIERSACLVATALAGMYAFAGKPVKFVIIGEGSLLWDGWHYQENIQRQLQALEVPEGAITIEHIKDSSINGAIGLLTK